MKLQRLLAAIIIAYSGAVHSGAYDGYFIDHKLDYPAFIGECSALLYIHSQGENDQDTYLNNYEKYNKLILNLNSRDDLKRSYKFSRLFYEKLSTIDKPNQDTYMGFHNDLTVCAYWSGAKKNQYYLDNKD